MPPHPVWRAIGSSAWMMKGSDRQAVVLVSGGLDSATVLAVAREQGFRCSALSFDYGQRHRVELAAAASISRGLGAADHQVARLDLGIGGSALTDPEIPVPEAPTEGIPATYVPARNTVLLAIALAQAEARGADTIFIGVNAVDFSGYPDCRPKFIDAFQRVAELGTQAGVEGHAIRIETPLMHLSKAEIIQWGTRLGVDYRQTVSCYQPDGDGRACGRCDACRLRAEGFRAAGLPDATDYR